MGAAVVDEVVSGGVFGGAGISILMGGIPGGAEVTVVTVVTVKLV